MRAEEETHCTDIIRGDWESKVWTTSPLVGGLFSPLCPLLSNETLFCNWSTEHISPKQWFQIKQALFSYFTFILYSSSFSSPCIALGPIARSGVCLPPFSFIQTLHRVVFRSYFCTKCCNGYSFTHTFTREHFTLGPIGREDYSSFCSKSSSVTGFEYELGWWEGEKIQDKWLLCSRRLVTLLFTPLFSFRVLSASDAKGQSARAIVGINDFQTKLVPKKRSQHFILQTQGMSVIYQI